MSTATHDTPVAGTDQQADHDHSLDGHPQHIHPSDRKYIKIAIILAVLTAIEVGVYYIEMDDRALIAILMPLMIAKFAIVAGYFMHLKFDSPLFTKLFVAGLAFAVGVYAVMLVTFEVWK
jgi:cytochrome c oxidase subunit IV